MPLTTPKSCEICTQITVRDSRGNKKKKKKKKKKQGFGRERKHKQGEENA